MEPGAPLESLLDRLPEPGNYYAGTAPFSLVLPRNIILFRRSRAEQLGPFRAHHHRFVLIVNRATEGSVIVDDRSLRLRPGQALLVYPHRFHHFMHIASAQVSWLFVTFELDDLESLRALDGVPVGLNRRAVDRAASLVAEYIAGRPAAAVRSDAVTLRTALLLSELLDCAARRPSPVPPVGHPTPGMARVDEVHRFVSAHLAEPFTTAQLAHELAVSPSHLRAVYKGETGMSLGSYVARMRLNRASGLLLNSAMSVKEVAAACGYESLFSFSRAFKRMMGVSPRHYRRLRARRH